jgi:hypothetical protein
LGGEFAGRLPVELSVDPPTRLIGAHINVPHYDSVKRHAASAKIQDSCFHRVPVFAGTTNSIVIALTKSD